MKKEFAFGLQKAGTLNGRYKVYKNPYQKSNMILMGYRGSQFLETGAVFAPYIPLNSRTLLHTRLFLLPWFQFRNGYRPNGSWCR